jgi:hypothetical protein
LGLRWDYFQPLIADHGLTGTFDPGIPASPSFPGGGGTIYPANSGFNYPGTLANGPPGDQYISRDNFAPRLGLAFGPWKDTAIRASYGIFYQQVSGNNAEFTNNPPISFINGIQSEPTTPTINIDQDVAAGTLFGAPTLVFRGPGVGLGGVELHPKTPSVQNWTLSLQHIFPHNFFGEIAYVGSRGNHLDKRSDINIATTPPPPGYTGSIQDRRPFPDFFYILEIEERAKLTYHALQVSMKKSMGSGMGLGRLTFLANYTWSKCLDMDSYEGLWRGVYPGDNWYAPCVYDQRQRFVLSLVYPLPGENLQNRAARALLGRWEISGITTVQSGFPFTVWENTDFSERGGIAFFYPNRICNGGLPSGQRSAARWFDTSCFPTNAYDTIGNSGYDILSGPGVANQDFALVKNFVLREPLRMQFRAEVFNLLNHPDLGGPTANPQAGASNGVISSISIPMRQVQFALKLSW